MSGPDVRYAETVRTLPKPTPRQTALFATYVSEAHSWYKHLPLFKTVPFHLFLDPGAGKYTVKDQNGRMSLKSIEDVEGHIHYTAQKTTDYRRRFGFWNYDAQYGSSLQYRRGDELIDTRNLGPRIVGEGGEWINVPEGLLELGRVEVSAFLHPSLVAAISPVFHSWRRDLKRDPSSFPFSDENLARAIAKSPPLPLPELPPEVSQAIDQHLREHVAKYKAGAATASDQPPSGGAPPVISDERVEAMAKWSWACTLWEKDSLIDELLISSGTTKAGLRDYYPALVEYLEFKRSVWELESATYRAEFGEFNSKGWFEFIASKRIRQLRGLKEAMSRVVQALYGEVGNG